MRAIDLAGNIGPAATRTVTVAAAPVVTFLSGPDGRLDPVSGEPDGASGTENAVFTFESDQPGSTFECSLDGVRLPAVRCGRPSRASRRAPSGSSRAATHEFAVRATNPQGIVGEEAVYEWLVQLGPGRRRRRTRRSPPGRRTARCSRRRSSRSPAPTTGRPRPTSAFECALDSTTSWNSCTSPEQFSDLTRGSHTLRVRAVDAAGNIESTPAEYTWIVAPPPVVTILSGPGVEQEETTDTTATFTFSSDVSPASPSTAGSTASSTRTQPGDPSQPAPCDPAGQTYTDLGIGDAPLRGARGRQFGNIGVWEDSEFRVTPSEARITSAPASGTSTTATFEFTSEPFDPDAVFYCSLDDRPFGLCDVAEDVHRTSGRASTRSRCRRSTRASTGWASRSSTTRSRPCTPGRSRTSRRPRRRSTSARRRRR